MNSLLHPFWTGNEMINELATPLRRPDGSVEDIALLYPADEILSAHDLDSWVSSSGGSAAICPDCGFVLERVE